jgi:hypothetical protein
MQNSASFFGKEKFLCKMLRKNKDIYKFFKVCSFALFFVFAISTAFSTSVFSMQDSFADSSEVAPRSSSQLHTISQDYVSQYSYFILNPALRFAKQIKNLKNSDFFHFVFDKFNPRGEILYLTHISRPKDCTYYFLRLSVLSSQAHPPT